MHVLHLTWEYPPLVYGGIGRHVPALAAAQAARGDRVTVVTQRPEGAPAQDMQAGVTVIRVDPDGPFPYHLPSLLTWVGALDARIGNAACEVADVDVVHAHDWVVGRAGATAANTHGVPLIATIHATEAGRHSGWLPDVVSRSVHLVEQWLVDDADAVIVCSAAMADEVERAHNTPARKISVIPNGIDPGERPAPGELAESLLQGHPRITFVGRLEWEKGVFTAVQAMPAVLARYPDARLRMVGTGSQQEALHAAILDAGVAASVDLLGHVDEQTLADVYASSDVVIAPSSYEPFGIVALEAAAAGIPLVVGDTGGLAEFVTEPRGRRHRPNHPDELAGQILAALADPVDTARRRDAASAALAEYSWARIAGRTDEVYARTGRGAPPPRRLAAPPNPVL
ncbi:MAG: glycosyltransferase family 4 protein [Actinobacteria bacterium]|nr:glycosyltransferase family 4 protein [Actinomycetota bacterium]